MIKGDPVMTHFPNVEIVRLYLRELTLADRQVVYEHFTEPDVTRFMILSLVVT